MTEQPPTITLIVEGTERPQDAPTVPAHLAGFVREARELRAFELRPAVRGEALETQTLPARPDDVLELTLEGGFRVWMSVEEYRKEFLPPAQRGALPTPQEVRVTAGFPARSEERGLVKWVVKGLKVLGIDVVQGAAQKIAAGVDLKKGLNGLYTFPLGEGTLTLRENPAFPSGSAPLLVFIHGTMSSTAGSFGGLWGASDAIRARLAQSYGENVYAFEHRTFTESPIENAIALASALPHGARLHLVSHSRGGMVGELICRCGRTGEGATPFDEEDYRLLSDPAEEGKLRQLASVIAAKGFQVERFLRVACPARGTTLASRRLDRYLSLLDNGLSVLDRTGWAADLGWLAASVVKERTDPKVMPGLAAMMPDAALIALLNRPGVTVNADLRVIAGDYGGDGILGRLADWAGEIFYDGLNDVVVNTPSMYGGAARPAGKGWYFFIKGTKVWHFSYFREAATASRLADGLLLDDAGAAGFKSLAEAPEKDEAIARGIVVDLLAEGIGDKILPASPSPRGMKPLAVLVPGIMGTHLKVEKERVWIDPIAIMKGCFAKLTEENREVSTDGMVKMAYGDFVAFLAQSHEVLPFPFDWRLSLRDEGKRFASFMSDVVRAAQKNGRPVRIVAHSMGGLLFRMAAVLTEEEGGTDWWDRLRAQKGSRVIMAGTPNGGSWMVPLALTGRADIIKTLAVADLLHDRDQLLAEVRDFEGFLEMLPSEGECTLFSPEPWSAWRVAGETWPLPDPAFLAKSRENRKLLERFDFAAHKGWLSYIAGCANETPMSAQVADGKLIFASTPEGDGRVLWSTGIPAAVPTWYLDAVHGDLLDVEESFQGIKEILETGSTTLLPTTPPLQRGPEAVPGVLPEREVPFYPDATLLMSAALGSHPARLKKKGEQLGGGALRVSVCHGDLASARYTVALGHYHGDTINGSEAALDYRLDGMLTRRYRLGVYPGPEGSCEIFFKERCEWGAIIVGLGQVGELTPQKLSHAFTRALLEYSTYRTSDSFSVSALLIGSGTGWGFGVRDSARALIEGAKHANEMLSELDNGRTRIEELEILELYEDRALQALHGVRDLASFGLLAGVDFDPLLRRGNAGRCRGMSEDGGGWWLRVKIELVEEALKFTTITGTARVEEVGLPTQRALVDSLIAAAIATPVLSEKDMLAIYNLVTPNALKERAPDQGDLLLMLDEGAAGYPWEMMHVGDGGKRIALALHSSLVRQLILRHYRQRPAYGVGLRALVVADPRLPAESALPALPAARVEGEGVAEALRSNGFSVEACFGSTPQCIISALFDGEYRIMHLAGHGIYRFEKRRRLGDCTMKTSYLTGMVLDWKKSETGEDEPVLLTAVEVQQLRRVPELVFINCCHLGTTLQEPQLSTLSGQNLFAASVATSFIKMGVRAVIAAGWAVNDVAAQVFAKTFYGAMLGGSTFGEAVLAARRGANTSAPGSNTWAAYQCYGDPDYRFSEAVQKDRPRVFLSPREALCDIRGIAAMRQGESDMKVDVARLEKDLERVAATIPHEWFVGNGEVRMALGDAYAAFGDLAAALEHYRGAAAAGDGGCSLGALEQSAALKARLAEERAEKAEAMGGTEDRGKAVGEAIGSVKEALAEIRFIIEHYGESKDRSLIAADAWRTLVLVAVAPREGVAENGAASPAVEDYRRFLMKCFEHKALSEGDFDPEMAMTWAALELIDLSADPEPDRQRLVKLVALLNSLSSGGAATGAPVDGSGTPLWQLEARCSLWLLGQLEEGADPLKVRNAYPQVRMASLVRRLKVLQLLLGGTGVWQESRGRLTQIFSALEEAGR